MCPNVMLGGSRDLIDGKSTGDKKKDVLMRKMSKDCYFTFFKGTKMDFGICDAQLSGSEARFGVEPTYMYERLKMIVIDWEKKISYIENGHSIVTGKQVSGRLERIIKIKRQIRSLRGL